MANNHSVRRSEDRYFLRRVRRDARQSQLIWTFCVALAVLFAALYQLGTPRALLGRQATSVPEALRTGAPLGPATEALQPERNPPTISFEPATSLSENRRKPATNETKTN